MRRSVAFSLACVVLTSLGCMDLAKEDGQRRKARSVGGVMTDSPMDAPARPAPPAPAQPAPDAEVAAAPAPPAQDPTTPFSAQPVTDGPVVGAPSESGNVETVAAKRGVGKASGVKGSGMIVTPLNAYFLTKQRTELEIKVPHALNLYKAEHGHFPKTQEDFMRDIIEFNQVKLPELPTGHRYVYDPKTGQLAVERPAE